MPKFQLPRDRHGVFNRKRVRILVARACVSYVSMRQSPCLLLASRSFFCCEIKKHGQPLCHWIQSTCSVVWQFSSSGFIAASTIIKIRPNLCVSVCVCLSVCLSVCVSVRLCFCPSVCLSVCLSVRLSVCLSVCLRLCLSGCLSLSGSLCVCDCLCLSDRLCLSVCLFVFLCLFFFCLSVRPSGCRFVSICACLSVCV